jgi:hypothetical protein
MKSPIKGADTDQNFAHQVLEPQLAALAATAPVHPARAEPTPRRAQGVFYALGWRSPDPGGLPGRAPFDATSQRKPATVAIPPLGRPDHGKTVGKDPRLPRSILG